MIKVAIVKEHKGLVRDLESKAILNIDDQSLIEHRNKKKFLKNLIENSNKIEKLESDISDIKTMLMQLLNKQGK
ncbi:hypothetical protein M0R04_04115 [Candidatus Dojkabacteria bacterium]|jgi:3-methyladenine DNA glycosylase Tag|nr:hypothetical protein [Candidatus Dojkabacteria bacterium]